MARRRRGTRDWWKVKALLETALRSQLGESVQLEIGWIRRLGGGLSRRAFIADVEVRGHDDWSRPYVVLMPHADIEPDFDHRAHQEAKVLAGLASCNLALRVPELIAVVKHDDYAALVETAVVGFPLELRAGRSPGGQPWQVVAEVAAAVHALDINHFEGLSGHPTRRSHAETHLTALEGCDEPLIRDARAWAEEHLPPSTPSVFLHGDLLGQNILLSLEGEPPGLIDWECAKLGDPALDLAIVTRGYRRPFQVEGGLDRLLDAYVVASGQQVKAAEVHIYELCMVGRWYQESLEGGPGHPPEIHLQQLRGILRRATGE